jgi:hypothetical protein
MSKAIVAILCVTAIVITGMFLGIDGYLYGLGVAAVSGLGGFAVREIAEVLKKRDDEQAPGDD